MKLRNAIIEFVPGCEQEVQDKRMMLNYMDRYDDLLTRDNETAHFTASAWITDPARENVLMIYHNIYDSWAWTGGHADGESDLLSTAIREAREETGITGVKAVDTKPISLEILPVSPHTRKGKFVVSHLHLNLTYLLEADPGETLRIQPDENSGVRWFSKDDAIRASSEAEMRVIYQKLNERMKR